MTSAVPAVIAWPLIVIMAAVIAGRYVRLNSTGFDRYLNSTLAMMFVVQLLRQSEVQHLLASAALISVATSQQLSLGFILLASTEFLGFITLWSGRSEQESRTLYIRYRAAGIVLLLAFFAVATRARRVGEPLEIYPGWDGAWAWALVLAMPLLLATQLLKMCIAEVLRGRTRRERLVAAAGVVVGLLVVVGAGEAIVFSFTNKLGWTDSVRFQLRAHSYFFFLQAVGATLIAAVPLLMKVLTRWGFDPVSRSWHKLQPLRASMRAAVPGIAFEFGPHAEGRQRNLLQLHQSAVEIRDAMLQLRDYFTDLPAADIGDYLASNGIPSRHRSAAVLALRLARAAQNKTAGRARRTSGEPEAVSIRPATLDEEIHDLLNLARWWPAAHAASTNGDVVG